MTSQAKSRNESRADSLPTFGSASCRQDRAASLFDRSINPTHPLSRPIWLSRYVRYYSATPYVLSDDGRRDAARPMMRIGESGCWDRPVDPPFLTTRRRGVAKCSFSQCITAAGIARSGCSLAPDASALFTPRTRAGASVTAALPTRTLGARPSKSSLKSTPPADVNLLHDGLFSPRVLAALWFIPPPEGGPFF